jgi:signal peptidase I
MEENISADHSKHSLSEMDRLYREVEEYNSPARIRQRKNKKIISLIGDIFFSIIVFALVYFIVVVGLSRESNDVPFFFGYSVQYVETESMVPTLPAGSVLLTRKVSSPSDIKVGYKGSGSEGDIITFYYTDSQYSNILVTHRAVETFEKNGIQYYVTKGDNNTYKDPNAVPFSRIVSVLVRRFL